MAKGSLRVNGIIVDADGELKASTGKSIVIREDDGSAVISVDTSGNVLIGGPTTVGVDDSGHDVKFFGATSGSYMLWDESADSLIVDGKIGIGTTAPSEKLQVNGNIKISDGGTIGSATTAGAITIAANGALTLSTAPAGFNYVATVTAAQTNSTDGIVIENSGTAAAGVTVAHADTTTQTSVNNSGRTYIQDITLDTYGHITGITSATETVTDTTYSVATNSALGLVQIGYTESGKNYPVELGSGTNANKMFVNVPWTDTNTTYSVANSSTLGLIKIGYLQTGKNYPVQLSSEQAYVNVPWTDTDTTYSVATTNANGLMSSSDKSKSDNMGLVYLDSITFAGNQQYSFDVNSYTSYTNYYIIMHNVRVGSAGGSILIRSGGSTNNQNQSKGNVKTWYGSLAGPVTYDDNVGNTTGMSMLKYTSSTSDEGLSGSFTLFAPRDSSICTTISGVWSGNYGDSLVTHVGGGIRTASYNDRYLTFMGYTSGYSSSTMSGGYARLYGIK